MFIFCKEEIIYLTYNNIQSLNINKNNNLIPNIIKFYLY